MNRRMVGHGNLAERAVLSVMPETETFPYTTRVSAEASMSFFFSADISRCCLLQLTGWKISHLLEI